MIYTLENIRTHSIDDNPVKYSKVIEGSKWKTHKLENDFRVQISNGSNIWFTKDFLWDRSSVPRLLWGLLSPDGVDDIAYLIHDWLYQNKVTSRKFADAEMLKWAKAMKQTKKWSLRNIDIHLRFYGVRAFGWIVWNKN